MPNQIPAAWALHPMQEAYFATLREQHDNLVVARVIFSSHDHYRVLLFNSTVEKLAKVRGHFHHENEEFPVVGDLVCVEVSESDSESLPIYALLPRRSSLKRYDIEGGTQTLVANVDYVGLVTSFNHDLNERRLERGLAMVNECGAKALILINKSDLVDAAAVETRLSQLRNRFTDTPVIPCSARMKNGIEEVSSFFKPGMSVAFLGMSGVGKSSLINTLIGKDRDGKDRLVTSEIRADDSRGRHTTTHREIFLTDVGYWIIDNPGIREFSFAGEEETLENTFEDIVAFSANCRFGNCSHSNEPVCGVKAALASGELSKDRWDNYRKMKREHEYQMTKDNKGYGSQKKKQSDKAKGKK